MRERSLLSIPKAGSSERALEYPRGVLPYLDAFWRNVGVLHSKTVTNYRNVLRRQAGYLKGEDILGSGEAELIYSVSSRGFRSALSLLQLLTRQQRLYLPWLVFFRRHPLEMCRLHLLQK